MKLLVVGSSASSRALAESLKQAGGRARVRHCADASSALETLGPAQESLAWAFLEQGVRGRPTAELVASIRGRHPQCGISFLRHFGEEAPRPEQPPLLCTLECGPDGVQRLGCALRRARAAPEAHPELAEVLDRAQTGFGFVAPIKSRG